MLVDLLLAAALAYGLAWLLNKLFFKEKPVSSVKAVLMTVVFFLLITIMLTAAMHYRRDLLGLPIKKLFDFSGIGISIIFYWTLNKVKKLKFEILTRDGGHQANFDSKEKAEEYVARNSDKNYSIKEK